MANKENKEKARAWRFAHRREVRTRVAATHLVFAARFAGLAAQAGGERRRCMAVAAAYQTALGVASMAMSLGNSAFTPEEKGEEVIGETD